MSSIKENVVAVERPSQPSVQTSLNAVEDIKDNAPDRMLQANNKFIQRTTTLLLFKEGQAAADGSQRFYIAQVRLGLGLGLGWKRTKGLNDFWAFFW